MLWREGDFNLAYVYARGYYEGRANPEKREPLDWMSADEMAVYIKGYDKGCEDHDRLDVEF